MKEPNIEDLKRRTNALLEQKAQLANEYLDMQYRLKRRAERAEKCIDDIITKLNVEVNLARCEFDARGNQTIIRTGEEALNMLFEISKVIKDYKEETK